MRYRTLWTILTLFAVALLLNSCRDNEYLWASIKGHWDLMSRARPIETVLAEEQTPPEVRTQLRKVLQLRQFAVAELNLPDNGSYHDYADLGRPYAVWNLVAAPELSLELNQWCFPVVGCVTYRGYFQEEAARTMAQSLDAQGFDVDVYGVKAYSTLNWFDDPVLNTFLDNDEIRLAALLFHEMAHQVLYIKDDTAFNESFAKTVEMEGLRRWFLASHTPELWAECQRRDERKEIFQAFLVDVRARLQEAYRFGGDNDQKRLAKQAILDQARIDYQQLKEKMGGFDGFDRWMKRGLNNARLSSVGTYHDLVPAFQELLRQVGGDLPAFYVAVTEMGALPKTERLARLQSLSPQLQAALD
ncbi:MAG: aminopeptidase [Desulfuromonadales bacterium]